MSRRTRRCLVIIGVDVGQVQNLPDAVDVGVRLGVDEAGVAVAGVAANAFACFGVRFISFQAERDGEGVDAELADVRLDGGHAGFVGQGRVGVGFGVEGLSGVEAAAVAAGDGGCGAKVAVDVEEFVGLGVEGSRGRRRRWARRARCRPYAG